jgi:hypothetical protein
MQIVVLGLIVNAMFTMTDAILIEMSHGAATHLRASKRFVFVLQRLGGGIAYRARCEARLGAAPLCLLSD